MCSLIVLTTGTVVDHKKVKIAAVIMVADVEVIVSVTNVRNNFCLARIRATLL